MRQHFSMTLSAILSIAISLLLCMVMAVLAINTDGIASSVESQLQLQVELSPVLGQERKEQIGQEIEDIEGVERASFSSKEQELQALIAENGDMFSQYESANPLFDIYVVDIADPDAVEDITAQISSINGVTSAQYGGSPVITMISVFQSVRTYGWLICIALIILCLFLIRNTVQMTIRVREDEIAIMRRVGAYNFYIQTPFLIEGMTIGFWGALIPAVIVCAGYSAVYYALDGALVSELFALYPPYPFLVWITAADLAAGLLLGALGSWLAAGRYLRRIR
jgi:cell division transport system permease protein